MGEQDLSYSQVLGDMGPGVVTAQGGLTDFSEGNHMQRANSPVKLRLSSFFGGCLSSTRDLYLQGRSASWVLRRHTEDSGFMGSELVPPSL